VVKAGVAIAKAWKLSVHKRLGQQPYPQSIKLAEEEFLDR
jgi:hypothetical protein